MRHKKRHASKKGSFAKLFRARNILIVSDHAVEHIPLSPLLQVALIAGILGFFSWISYTTGSYMAASSVIQEKDEKIVAASIEKKRIGEEMLMLKRDLVKLNKSGKDLSEYDQFVIQQHADQMEKDSKMALEGALFSAGSGENAMEEAASSLDKRLGYLEKQVETLQQENHNIVMTIYERTKGRITLFEDVIAMSGLKPEQMKARILAKNKKDMKRNKRAMNAEPEEVGSLGETPDAGHQGGPYIPVSDEGGRDFSPEDWQLGLDRMLLLQQVLDAMPLAKPVKIARMTSGFGRRQDPFRRRWSMHEGLDFAAPKGAKIYATSDGVIKRATYHRAYGNVVDIEHGLGISTRYGHMHRLLVKKGQHVKEGDLIGIQGTTGRSTGDHLHYEVRLDGQALNPKKFIQAGRYVLSKN